MRDDSPKITSCARCGDRVGVYEPAVVEHESGELVETSLLRERREERRRPLRVWHRSCHGRIRAPRGGLR